MPKINVYLPDDLAAAVRRARVPVSTICQQALSEAVRVAGEGREAVEALRNPGFDPQRHPEIAARMTPRLRDALRLAGDLAGPRGPVEPEHLLLGLIEDADNLAVRILQLLDADVPALRAAATTRTPTPRGARRREEALPAGLSTTARRVIAAALEGAIDLGHAYVGSEHLLLGLAAEAGELLGERGITPDRVRRAIPAAVGAAALGYRDARQTLPPATAGRLEAIDRRLDALERRLQAGGL